MSLALIMSYVEALIPFSFGIPGIKLGLTNIVIVFLLYTANIKDTITVAVARIVLAGFLFGNLFSILYSLAGGLFSLFIMALFQRSGRFHTLSVSVAGGISHNFAQLLVAALVIENLNVFYYFPVLLLAGALTGLLIGILADIIIRRISHIREK